MQYATPFTVGGKAAGLYAMTEMGLNVPHFLCIPVKETFLNHSMERGTLEYLKLASVLRCHFGNASIFSVRSGAPVSMPGMMDTLLNLGIDNTNFADLLELYGPVAYDIRARLTRQFSCFEGMDDGLFKEAEHHVNVFYGINDDPTEKHKALDLAYSKVRGRPLPSRMDQLAQAIKWVWESYHSERATAYRDLNDLDHSMGTAVVIQSMVFGNFNSKSGTGVAFSHDPNTGEKGVMGDFLSGGQGEEVVSGIVNPQPLVEVAKDPTFYHPIKDLRKALYKIINNNHYDMVDCEFTIQDGELFFLQIREAKCSTRAKVRMLVDKVSSGIENATTVTDKLLKIVSPDTLQEASLGVNMETLSMIGTALGAVEGVALGKIATTHAQADAYHQSGEPFIFVSEETSPNDLVPMSQATGILTGKGGMLSHAAIIAREWDKPCIVAFGQMDIVGPDCISVGDVVYSEVGLQIQDQVGKVMA
jgi:pyruvate,orthophosphate dikinase